MPSSERTRNGWTKQLDIARDDRCMAYSLAVKHANIIVFSKYDMNIIVVFVVSTDKNSKR